jgi:phosphatidylserine decarboxylase
MRKPRTSVAQEGYPFIGACAFVTLIAAILGYPLLTLVLLTATLFVLMFFRDPERFVPEDPTAVVSPADGKIIVAERVTDTRFGDEQFFKISIFMNVFNVHVNRIPFSGHIERVHHVPGKFLAADHDSAHLKNEYCAVHLVTENNTKLIFVQIAGLLARRIICRLEPNDRVERGRRFGLIRFGSRVDLYLPADSKPAVQVGQKVRAAESILAHLQAADS